MLALLLKLGLIRGAGAGIAPAPPPVGVTWDTGVLWDTTTNWS